MYFLIFIVILILLFFLINHNRKKEPQKNILEEELTEGVYSKGKEITSENKIVKSNSTAIGFEGLKIPKYREELLYVSPGDPLNTGLSHSIHIDITPTGVKSESHGPDEPSAIFIKQPIKKPENPKQVAELGYFPSYAQMSPFQKWIYLDWLCDVTKHIDTGYVFTYYYGLERRLVSGQLEEAFNEINLLRRHHENRSFQTYSINALINAINIKKRFDLLEDIYFNDNYNRISNSALYVSYKLEFDLQSDVLISIVNSISGTNRRYIKKNKAIYKELLESVLNEKYSMDAYPFSKVIDINNVKNKKVTGFANYSLTDEHRELSYPDFLSHKSFKTDVLECHEEAHERTKIKLREIRKRRKNT